MKFFENVKLFPPDPILGLNQAFHADMRGDKVNLGVGAYKTSDLKPLILNTVKKAERDLLHEETSKDYLPIDGLSDYFKATRELVFASTTDNDRIVSAQTVGGTAALRVGSVFLRQQGFSTIYVSDPTWENHHRVFKQAGLEVKTYPYLDTRGHCFNMEAFKEAILEIPFRQIIVLQPCCHNPTGTDPTFDEWVEISKVVRERELFVFFDVAYQGYGVNIEKADEDIR